MARRAAGPKRDDGPEAQVTGAVWKRLRIVGLPPSQTREHSTNNHEGPVAERVGDVSTEALPESVGGELSALAGTRRRCTRCGGGAQEGLSSPDPSVGAGEAAGGRPPRWRSTDHRCPAAASRRGCGGSPRRRAWPQARFAQPRWRPATGRPCSQRAPSARRAGDGTQDADRLPPRAADRPSRRLAAARVPLSDLGGRVPRRQAAADPQGPDRRCRRGCGGTWGRRSLRLVQ